MPENDLILKAATGQPVERTPVWLMRQAGRILPEYRAVRQSAGDFKTLVKTPELAAEVTIQPVDILEVDAAIIFSDILVVPEAMGLDYEMVESKGPIFPRTITERRDVDRLTKDNAEALNYVQDAIRLTKKELNDRVPLIGFAGAPFTIFCYMVEGSGSKTFSKARKLLYRDPQLSKELLERITNTTITYLKAQVDAGADLLQLFDSWGGILTKDHFATFSLPYIRRICKAINEVPVTVFAKGANDSLNELATSECQTVGLDWYVDPRSARTSVGKDRTLQGNLDPAALYGSKELIRKKTRAMLRSFGPHRYIANLGHGVYPDTEVSAVQHFIETVKTYEHETDEIYA